MAHDKKGMQRVVWTLAALAMAAGVLLSLRGMARWNQREAWLQRKVDDLQAVDFMLQDYRRYEPLLRELAGMEPGTGYPLRTGLNRFMPDVEVEVFQRETVPLAQGWGLHRMEFSLDQVPLESVGQLIVWLEQQQPPWRVTAVNIQSSDRVPGTGRVRLTLEGLQHEGAHPARPLSSPR